MTYNFNSGLTYSIYTDPTFLTGQTAYTTNPMMSMAPSIFAMNYNSIPAAAYALGGLANLGTMNTDLLKPQWMQNMDNPFKFNQFDFTQMYTYNPFQQGNVTNPFNASPAGTQQNPAVTGTAPAAIDETTQKLNMYGISSTGDKEKDAKALKAAQGKQDKIETDAANIAEELYDAMKGAGTKNDKLKSAVAKINKDNILYVLEAWNTNFADSMDGESLIESIQNEHYTGWFGHQQEDLENHIADALFKKAQELDLKNEGHAFRAKVNAEHSAWFTSDETVRNAFDNIIAQVSAKDAQVRTEKAQRAYQNNK